MKRSASVPAKEDAASVRIAGVERAVLNKAVFGDTNGERPENDNGLIRWVSRSRLDRKAATAIS